MKWGSFQPKKWEEDDVDIKITHCSICGADCHSLRSGWGATPYRKLILYSICSPAVASPTERLRLSAV